MLSNLTSTHSSPRKREGRKEEEWTSRKIDKSSINPTTPPCFSLHRLPYKVSQINLITVVKSFHSPHTLIVSRHRNDPVSLIYGREETCASPPPPDQPSTADNHAHLRRIALIAILINGIALFLISQLATSLSPFGERQKGSVEVNPSNTDLPSRRKGNCLLYGSTVIE